MAYKSQEDRAAYGRRHYKKHKRYYIEKSARYRKAQIKWFQEFKATLLCKICGENDPSCLDFHHRQNDDKEHEVSSLINHASRKRILDEIAKCDVLCANCHRKVHKRERDLRQTA